VRDIHEVLRRKQAEYAQLQKQIEVLRLAAPLLADGNEGDTAVLAETKEETQQPMSRAASASNPAAPASRLPRWSYHPSTPAALREKASIGDCHH
jgi:hypothetical protein